MDEKALQDCEDEYVKFFDKMTNKYGAQNSIINIAKVTMSVLDHLSKSPENRELYDILMVEFAMQVFQNAISQPQVNDELMDKFRDDVEDILGDD